MNRRPSQSRTGFDSFSPQHTAHFKAAQPGGEFFEPKPRASLGRRLLLALLLMTLIALAVNLAVNQFVRVARVTVPIRRMDPAFEGYTLLQISDLKGATYGSNQALIRFALQNEDFDAVVFTGGIGENDPGLRQYVVEHLGYLGVKLEAEANHSRGKEVRISTPDSKIEVWVIPTDEEMVIARDTLALIEKRGK